MCIYATATIEDVLVCPFKNGRFTFSLVIVSMHAMRSLVSVQSGITELATKESLCELRRSGEILGRDILRDRLVSVRHRRRLEERISDIQSVGGVDDFVALVGETFSGEHL